MPADDLYDEIASLYHLVYEDWESSVRRQADALDAVLRETLGPGPHSILDVSCGIGTQTLGLAALGHRITASDPSTASVERARREAAARGLSVTLRVGRMQDCETLHEGSFDVVLSADNSIPHLESEAEMAAALRALRARARPGGLVLFTLRDYDREDRTPRQLRPYGIRETPEGRVLVFQTWDWDDDGEHYDVAMYFVRDDGVGRPQVTVGRSRYTAIGTGRLLALMDEAGLVETGRRDDVFFQPVLLGREPG